MRDIHDVWHVLTGYATDALARRAWSPSLGANKTRRGLRLIAVAAANAHQARFLPREHVLGGGGARRAQRARAKCFRASITSADAGAAGSRSLRGSTSRRPDHYRAIDQAARAQA